MGWQKAFRNFLFMTLCLPVISLLCVIKSYQFQTVYELLRHNIAEGSDVGSVTTSSNASDDTEPPVTIAFAEDIEMERKLFGVRDEWRPYMNEEEIRVKVNRPEGEREVCRTRVKLVERVHYCGCPSG